MNIFLGDIHGEFVKVQRYIKRYDITDADIYQVGDLGVGFHFLKEQRQLKILNEALVKRNIFFYAIRGNHDDPAYFLNDPFQLSNIKLLPDYTVMETNGQKILLIGGAISVDRGGRYTTRQKIKDYKTYGNESWWHDEVFVLDEEKLKTFTNIDVVVTHTSPSYCEPFMKGGVGGFVEDLIRKYGDLELRGELMDERILLDKAFEILSEKNDIKFAYYGHFHNTSVTENNGIKHRLLDIDEFYTEPYY
jgi:predicted phosphodiesterase